MRFSWNRDIVKYVRNPEVQVPYLALWCERIEMMIRIVYNNYMNEAREADSI